MSRKKLAILGSTGSIGRQTLDVVRKHPDQFEVVSLAAGTNHPVLQGQIEEFSPKVVSVLDKDVAQLIERQFPHIDVTYGEEGNLECVRRYDPEVVVMGIVGFAALRPTLESVRLKKKIALANKEVLVVAGELLNREIERHQSLCIPVDSEHNALFQLLENRSKNDIKTLIITASGGPLLRHPEIPLEDVTPQFATNHPKWKMGPKISVDSATLMNKGLELIEACTLFRVPVTQVEVWIHPQSIFL